MWVNIFIMISFKDSMTHQQQTPLFSPSWWAKNELSSLEIIYLQYVPYVKYICTVLEISLRFNFVISIAFSTYEKSFQEKVALFKIFISSTKYTSTCVFVCMRLCVQTHENTQFYISVCNLCIRKWRNTCIISCCTYLNINVNT